MIQNSSCKSKDEQKSRKKNVLAGVSMLCEENVNSYSDELSSNKCCDMKE